MRGFISAFVVVAFLWSSSAFAAWQNDFFKCSQSEASSQCQTKYQNSTNYWRITGVTNAACGAQNIIYYCQINGSNPCTNGQIWNQTSQLCENPACPAGTTWSAEQQQCMPDAPQCPAGANWNGEACICPPGSKMGFAGSVEGGLTQQCVQDPPPPQECDNPIGSYGGNVICDQQHTCPAGYIPGIVNGEQVCMPPIEDDPSCPNGGYYGEVNGVSQCWDPMPNVDNPDYPPNADPTSPSYPGLDPSNPTYPNDPSWPSANNPNYSGGSSSSSSWSIDLSPVTNQLQQLNNKAQASNAKLDAANASLDAIEGVLNGPASGLPGHSQASFATFGEVNTAFRGRIEGAPVVQAFTGVAGMISLDSAACPEYGFSLDSFITGTFATSIHCDLYTEYAGIFSAVMLVIYTFTAFRIFASS